MKLFATAVVVTLCLMAGLYALSIAVNSLQHAVAVHAAKVSV